MAISDKAKFALSSDPLFLKLPDATRLQLLERAVTNRVRQGETIYCIGDPAGGIYFICDGGMRVEIATGSDNIFIAHYLAPGMWFGEPSALTGQPRMVGVVAAQDSEMLHLSLPHLNQLTRADPEFLRHLAAITQIYLRTAIAAIADLMIRDTEIRFIATLLRLGGIRDGAPQAGRFDVFFSQEEIAVMANVARTTANTILRKLEKSGLIEITYRRIAIVDGPRLRALVLKEA